MVQDGHKEDYGVRLELKIARFRHIETFNLRASSSRDRWLS